MDERVGSRVPTDASHRLGHQHLFCSSAPRSGAAQLAVARPCVQWMWRWWSLVLLGMLPSTSPLELEVVHCPSKLHVAATEQQLEQHKAPGEDAVHVRCGILGSVA